mmetsp:Transcript_8047/g.17451  ORF Transcript_8047/g.17451 Transcript_8047/m.17451 type:complete len:98 (+) Transcript_8047:115-408(+)
MRHVIMPQMQFEIPRRQESSDAQSAIHVAKAPTTVPVAINSQNAHWYAECVTEGPSLMSFNEAMAKDQDTIDKTTSVPKITLLIQVKEFPQQPQVTI